MMISKIFESILTCSDIQGDVWSGYSAMQLAFSICIDKELKKEKSVQVQVIKQENVQGRQKILLYVNIICYKMVENYL